MPKVKGFYFEGREAIEDKPVQDVVGMLTKDYLSQAIEFAIKKHKECAEKSTPLSLSYIS